MIPFRERRKARLAQTDEAIHIVALWNLMLILIPFLLLSASFSQTSILNLMIPSVSAAPEVRKEGATSREPIHLTLKLTGFNLEQGMERNRSIPLKAGQYDFPSLTSALEEMKRENPAEETIVLSASPKVSYDVVIQAMDQCREARFPNITLGADSTEEAP